ncbi:hypothetical protein BC628DRAFT_1506524 [Trametes gibbosa]|nr:hypothetical protein BC628DRAFT_1506524 [Trametes gibbosa]
MPIKTLPRPPFGHRPRLPPRLIPLKQRFLLQRRWRWRSCRVNSLRNKAISTLVGLLFICVTWTAMHAVSITILSKLNLLFPPQTRLFLVWHSLLYAATFVHALFTELGLDGTYRACRRGLHDDCSSDSNERRSFQRALSRGRRTISTSPKGFPVTVFVCGASTRTVALKLSLQDRVSDVISRLRHQRRIPPPRRIRHYLLFPPFSMAPLSGDAQLGDIGIMNGSTLHLRLSVVGGARDSSRPDAAAGKQVPTWCTRFEHKNGKFPSAHPEDWIPLLGDIKGRFQCLLCEEEPAFERRHITRHERTDRHKNNRAKKATSNKREGAQYPGGSSGMPSTSVGSSATASTSPVTMPVVRAALLDMLEEIAASSSHRESEQVAGFAGGSSEGGDHDEGGGGDRDEGGGGIIDWEAIGSPVTGVTNDTFTTCLSQRLYTYLQGDGAISEDSEDDEQDVEEVVEPSPVSEGRDSLEGPRLTSRRRRFLTDEDLPSFPWPDRETCVLDILRHVPRCAFSDKQNAVIHWALLALGVKDVPSEYVVDQVAKALQNHCGISSIRYDGALGHVYYVNDLAGIIAQEMANPRVRPYLRTLPEDSGTHLSQAWHAARWKDELDPDLATPMVRYGGEDFYVYELAPLHDGRFCMPVRWFTRGGETFATAWQVIPTLDNQGWVVLKHRLLELNIRMFATCWENFKMSYQSRRVPDPRRIIGIQETPQSGISPWTHTDPEVGNRWRGQAKGHRVVAFPIWLYCDDTSGNLSKKWNKHNSFLFTAAGLPRHLVHREYSIHFLATSNIAPPLEMLDGIVEQLEECQTSGIWAWDCVDKEMVLVIPSVLAMLGDNPMQSEIACHVGLAGNLFCRVCKVSRGTTDEGAQSRTSTLPRASHTDDAPQHSTDADSDASSMASSGEDHTPRHKGRGKKLETMAEMVDRITRFMKELRSQFTHAQRIGGQASVLDARTRTGVKDTYQAFFVAKLCALTTKRGRSREARSADVQDYLKKIPHVDDAAISPVWRIRDFDPHSDTPVEILHVILLGFVKYLWRDSVSRLSDAEKKTVIARLSSFDVTGLGIPSLSGTTLVTYAKSLVGRDFRAVAQAAPFVLHDLAGIPPELQKVWTALAHLVPLVWQPEIAHLPAHMKRLSEAIDHFLNATCALTPRWFNKPKFHVILHLPDHIRRFGPAMLFATEGFESFNAVIRSHSIHSNHRAPSRDIAVGMAHHNRIRHFLSGGTFYFPHIVDGQIEDDTDTGLDTADNGTATHSTIVHLPWIRKTAWLGPDRMNWRTIGSEPQALLSLDGFDSQILGALPFSEASKMNTERPGLCMGVSAPKRWSQTQASKHCITSPAHPHQQFRTAEKLRLHRDSGWCKSGGQSWLIWHAHSGIRQTLVQPVSCTVGRVWEILQIEGSQNQNLGRADFLLLERCLIGARHPFYDMPGVVPSSSYVLVAVEVHLL